MASGKRLAVGFAACAAAVFAASAAFADDIAKYDKNMAVEGIVVTNGIKWIDGKLLPIEGRAFNDVEHYYDRLPAGVTTNVNGGVRGMKCHSAGMQFRFRTGSKKLIFRWRPTAARLSLAHMPATGVSGIDVYRFDEAKRRWMFVATGKINNAQKGARLEVPWIPGEACLVNLPLYNGIASFSLGIDSGTLVEPLGRRASGVEKPVVVIFGSVPEVYTPQVIVIHRDDV